MRYKKQSLAKKAKNSYSHHIVHIRQMVDKARNDNKFQNKLVQPCSNNNNRESEDDSYDVRGVSQFAPFFHDMCHAVSDGLFLAVIKPDA